MKNRYFFLMMGALLPFVCGCDSTPKAAQPSQTNSNPQQSDNEDEDGDDGAYGDKDTSSQRDAGDVSPVFPTDPVAEIDVQQILMGQAIEHAAVALADSIVAVDEEGAPIVLEAVEAIELPSEVAMVEEASEE